MSLDIEKVVKQMISNNQLEDFLNNEKLLSFDQKYLDRIHLIIIEQGENEYIRKIKNLSERACIR